MPDTSSRYVMMVRSRIIDVERVSFYSVQCHLHCNCNEEFQMGTIIPGIRKSQQKCVRLHVLARWLQKKSSEEMLLVRGIVLSIESVCQQIGCHIIRSPHQERTRKVYFRVREDEERQILFFETAIDTQRHLVASLETELSILPFIESLLLGIALQTSVLNNELHSLVE